jgi:methylmalonyl-CoA/ethylmalonyl-CoA epimerase
MKTISFSHIGIVVKNLDEAVKLYTDVLGINPKNIKTGGRPDFMRIANIMIGDDRIELLEFHDKKTNPIATIGEEYNHALQHIGVYVDSVAGALREFKASGAKMLDETPRSMPDGHKIGFVIPKNTELLIELMEK